MDWSAGFIAVDWGTTNRRAYRLDPGRDRPATFEDDQGALAVGKAGFPAAAADIRARLGDLPMLLGGMAGSTLGWADAPYLPCPVTVADLADALVWVEDRKTAIVPGAKRVGADRADVMRGEEIQLLGAVEAGLIPAECRVCHPGTHSKWARMEGGRLEDFRTAMTGELFNLLREHSILAEHLRGDADPGPAFDAGVRKGLEGGLLTAQIFSVRASVLLGQMEAEDAPAFLSGLLVGADVMDAIRDAPSAPVVVMGRPSLTGLYARAIAIAGGHSRQVDGETAFVAGANAIMRCLQ